MLQTLLHGAVALASFLGAYAQDAQLEMPRLTQSAQRQEFPLEGEESSFKFSFLTDGEMTDSETVHGFQVSRSQVPFLSTLAAPGLAQFLTFLKPCSIVNPHIHLRANEFYSVIYGTMSAGIAQENGSLQNITFPVGVAETMVVPQGTLHFNHNQECTPNVFFQTFSSTDPGAINIVGALAAFSAAGGDALAATTASGAAGLETVGSFSLDQACLKRCSFPETGAPGDGLQDLPPALRVLAGLN